MTHLPNSLADMSDWHVVSHTQKGRPVRGGLSISEARGAISLEVDQTTDANIVKVFKTTSGINRT
ncbi:MAG: hypothetical protein K2Q28_14285, partial [Hyphomicrobium sp.]|nr:hypothetical protein [Hyphomicrobium sp.]